MNSKMTLISIMIEKELKVIFHIGSVDSMTESPFYERILSRLRCEKSLVQNRLYQDNRTAYYFQLRLKREDLSRSLNSTNEEIIFYLLG